MNPFSDLFRRHQPPTVAECMAAAAAAPSAPVEQRVNDDGRTYLLIAHWPDRKITYDLGIGEVAERVRLSLLAGATHIDVEPEWSFTRGAA